MPAYSMPAPEGATAMHAIHFHEDIGVLAIAVRIVPDGGRS